MITEKIIIIKNRGEFNWHTGNARAPRPTAVDVMKEKEKKTVILRATMRVVCNACVFKTTKKVVYLFGRVPTH